MHRPLLIFLLCLGIALAAAVTPARADLNAPKLGARMAWKCIGPYSSRYDLTVVRIKDGMVRYEGVLDGNPYWVEKPAALTGTSLWVALFDDRAQWFDMEDFEGFRKLEPGARFKGAVPARHGEEKWVWDYEVSVGRPKTIYHPVLGNVDVISTSEQRKVFHGDYWSRMSAVLEPVLGITVSWVYEDPRGTERCDLSAFSK